MKEEEKLLVEQAREGSEKLLIHFIITIIKQSGILLIM